MIGKIELGSPVPKPIFADPAPLGYIGLALGCAAQIPIAFGAALSPIGLRTAAVICLLFGAVCPFIAGIMSFANKNLFGGVLLTLLSFSSLIDSWAIDMLAAGQSLDHNSVILTTDSAMLIVFLVLTYGFGFISKLLVGLLVNIDLLYIIRIINNATGGNALDLPIAILVITLGVLLLWIAFTALINPIAGQQTLPFPGPFFYIHKRPTFDLSLRQSICEVLYRHFKDQAFQEMPIAELQRRIKDLLGEVNISPDLFYLGELGALVITFHDAERSRIAGARLSAAGIDMHEQVMLKKSDDA
jgi:succinate-acetate transporter protein